MFLIQVGELSRDGTYMAIARGVEMISIELDHNSTDTYIGELRGNQI